MDQNERMTAKAFLGEEVCGRFGYAYPVLRLLLTRSTYDMEDERRIYGLLFVNNGPALYAVGSGRVRLEYISRLPAYHLNRLFHRARTTDNILVSDTLLVSDRYSFYQQECANDDRIVGLSLIHNHYSLTGHKKTKFNRCVNLGRFIVDPDTIRQILKLFHMIKGAYTTKKACTEIPGYADEVKLLNDLMAGRIELIKRELLRNNVHQYITCNQYRVEEIAVIEACRELGIVTKEWSHHSMCSFDIHLYETPPESFISDLGNFYIYTDYYCCWSPGDVEWIKKHGSVEPIFDQSIRLISTGSPEIHKNMAVAEKSSDPERGGKCISYMVVTRYLDGRNDKEICDAHHRILEELHKLAEKEHAKVLVRNHPSQLFLVIEGDMELYEKYGFEVVDNSRESLLKMYADSQLCFSCGTSGLVMAYNYGVKTYSVIIKPRGEFDYEGTGIEEIGIDEIAGLHIPDERMTLFPDAMRLEDLYRIVEE